MYKRPQVRKKPAEAAPGGGGAPAEPGVAPSPAKLAAGGGLLGGILQNVAKMDEGRSKAALPGARRPAGRRPPLLTPLQTALASSWASAQQRLG